MLVDKLTPEQQRRLESIERPVFEGYIQRVLPHHWPNPDLGGSRTYSGGAFIGQYHNNRLNSLWQCWMARALVAVAEAVAESARETEAK